MLSFTCKLSKYFGEKTFLYFFFIFGYLHKFKSAGLSKFYVFIN